MPKSSAPKPLIAVKDVSVGGNVRENAKFYETGQDLTYVAGYSDKRREVERAMAERRDPEAELTHRLQWVRTKRINGGADTRKVIEFRSKGYRPVRADELPNLGFDPMAWEKTAEGGVRNGDCELFICDAETAEKNQELARRAVELRTTGQSGSELHRAAASAQASGAGNVVVPEQLEQKLTVTKT